MRKVGRRTLFRRRGRSSFGFLALVFVVGLFLSLSLSSETFAQERPEKRVRAWPFLHTEEWPDGRHSVDAFFSMYHSSSDGSGRTRWFAPLFWSRDNPSGVSWSLLVPAYFRYRSPQSWGVWSLPVSTGGQEHGSEVTPDARWWHAPGFLPLYRQRRAGEESELEIGLPRVLSAYSGIESPRGRQRTAITLLPWRTPAENWLSIYRSVEETESGRTLTQLFPLYLHESVPAQEPSDLGESETSETAARGRTLIFPLLSGRWWEGDRRTDIFGPLLAHRIRSDDGGSWGVLLDAIGGGREGDRRWTQLEPIYSYESSPTATSFHVAHLYGYEADHEAGTRVRRILDPLGRFYRGPDGVIDDYFVPFYFHAKRGTTGHLAVLPFYARGTSLRRSFRFVFPSYVSRDIEGDRLRALVPFYFSGRTSPLDEEGNPDESVVHSGFDIVVPFYWSTRRTWGGTKSRLDSILGPIALRTVEEGPESTRRSQSILWPLFASATETDASGERIGWHRRALPFAWFTREGDRSFDLVAPIYLRLREKSRSHTWILPAWAHLESTDEEGREHRTSLYGLGAVMRSSRHAASGDLEARRWSILGAAAMVSEDITRNREHTHVFPFYLHRRTGGHEWRVVAPVYVQRSRTTEEIDDRITLFLGSTWLDIEDRAAGTRERGVLWPLVRWRSAPESSSFSALFLLDRRTGPGGERQWRATPFAAQRQGTRSSWLPWAHLYSREEGPWGSRTSVMPFLYHADEREDVTTRWAAFGMWGKRRSPTERHDWALPFYAREQTVDDETGELVHDWRIFFPVYMQSRRERGAVRSFSILPLLYSHLEDDRSGLVDDRALFGLVARTRSADSSSFRAVPLWSHRFDSDGARRWKLSVLFDRRIAGEGQEVRGTWSKDGYLSLSFLRHTSGASSRTWSLNPFLFSRHTSGAQDHSSWNVLGIAANGQRWGENGWFHVLGLVRGSRHESGGLFSVFPLVRWDRENAQTLPRLRAAEFAHLFCRTRDAEQARWSLLTPLFARGSRGPNDDHEFRLGQRWVEFRRNGDYRERAIRPLFAWESDPSTGYEYFSLGTFLYQSERSRRDAPVQRRILGIPL